MKALKFRLAEDEADPGEWMRVVDEGPERGSWKRFEGDDHTKSETPLFKVRMISQARENGAKKMRGLRESIEITRAGDVRPDGDPKTDEARRLVHRDLAMYAMVDTFGVDLEVATPGIATRLSDLLGREVKLKEEPRLDGLWGKRELREYLFDTIPAFAAMTVAAGVACRAREARDEAGKG